MIICVINTATGEIITAGTELPENNPPEGLVEGTSNYIKYLPQSGISLHRYVDERYFTVTDDYSVAEIKTRELKPHPEYIWDYTNEVWVPNPAAIVEIVRQKRNILLQASDWSLAVDSPLTEEQRQEVITYRGLLRDLPASETLTTDFAPVSTGPWPLPPSCLGQIPAIGIDYQIEE